MGSLGMETAGEGAAREVTINTIKRLRVSKSGVPVLTFLVNLTGNRMVIYASNTIGSLTLRLGGVLQTRTLNDVGYTGFYANGRALTTRLSIWGPANLTASNQTVTITSSDPAVSIQLVESRQAVAPRGLPVREGLIIDDVQKGLLRGRSGVWVPFGTRGNDVTADIYTNTGGRSLAVNAVHFFALGDVNLDEWDNLYLETYINATYSNRNTSPVNLDALLNGPRRTTFQGRTGGSTFQWHISLVDNPPRIRFHQFDTTIYVFRVYVTRKRYGFFA